MSARPFPPGPLVTFHAQRRERVHTHLQRVLVLGAQRRAQLNTEVGGRGSIDDPFELSSDDEPPAPAPAPAPAPSVTVTVQLWDLALHPTQRNIGGYVTFRCTVTRAGASTTGFMGTNVTANSQDEWSFPVSSQSVVINMVQPTEPYLRKYMNSALKNGRYYVQNGQPVGLPHPPVVAALVTGMQAVGAMRAQNGQPDIQLRPFLMQTLNLNARQAQRERGMYGDMSLTGLDWVFAHANAWRRVLDGERRYVETE